MYIYLGGDKVVTGREIIGIFDIDNCSIDKRTREFLKTAQQNGQIINAADDLPKSFVICGTDDDSSVYISGITTSTLKKRSY